jgi:hypothetical protein
LTIAWRLTGNSSANALAEADPLAATASSSFRRVGSANAVRTSSTSAI